MINIRYHIFSLIAVFAALAIGLTIGTTVVRGPLVDNLRQNLDRVEARNETVRQENENLRQALADARVLDEEGAALLFGRAQGSLVLIVEESGADGETTRSIRQAFSDGGAILLGRIQVDSLETMAAADVANALRFVRALVDTASVDIPVSVSTLLRDYLSSALAAGTVQLKDLREEEVTLSTSVRIVVLSDRNNEGGDWRDFVRTLVGTFVGDTEDSLPVVVEIDDLDLSDDTELDPSVIGAIREDEELRVAASTVDNASHFAGWAAAVLAAENSLSRVAVHLGVHEGSEGLLPAIR